MRAHGAHGGDLLGKDVERAARDLHALDGAFVHLAHDDGALEQVAFELGEDDALAELPYPVAGAANALQAAGDGAGGLDEEDEVDRPHVDAQLEGGGSDDAAEASVLEGVFDFGALLVGDAAVVGADEVWDLAILRIAWQCAFGNCGTALKGG